ncbi:MAG: glucosyltransferase domain-containing protein [Acutalibacteraceae bacterium]|nr:glucosyltransferase domain-containing protein [Acutalibacteraceae bacterium]
MGENIIKFYRFKCKTEWKISFFSTFIIGLITHLYKFANDIPIMDTFTNSYHEQNMIMSGRWFLTIATSISSYFDLVWVIGLLSLLFISLSMVLITEIFKLTNPVLITLCGAILVTFPAATEIFFFSYTADGYMIALFLSCIAVYLTVFDCKIKYRYIISGCCLCFSCAIYQAYIPFALVLSVCYLMYQLLENNYTDKQCTMWCVKQVGLFGVALAAYYALWKLLSLIEKVEETSYLGIDKVGSVSFSLIINGFKAMVLSLGRFFIEGDSLSELTFGTILNVIFIICFIAIIIFVAIKSKLIANKKKLILFIVCIISLPFCICLWSFVSTEIYLGTARYFHSIAMLYIFVGILFERWTEIKAKNFSGFLLAIIAFNFCLEANISYYLLNKSFQASYATAVAIQSKMQEKEFENIIITGRLTYDGFGKERIPYLGRGIDYNYLYRESSVVSFLETYFSTDLEVLYGEERVAIESSQEVKDMECWPSEGSMKVIDDTLVIKFG